jgi:hypothetical protein
MAFDIAAHQILTNPVSGFLEGRALRMAERKEERQSRRWRIQKPEHKKRTI